MIGQVYLSRNFVPVCSDGKTLDNESRGSGGFIGAIVQELAKMLWNRERVCGPEMTAHAASCRIPKKVGP